MFHRSNDDKQRPKMDPVVLLLDIFAVIEEQDNNCMLKVVAINDICASRYNSTSRPLQCGIRWVSCTKDCS